MSKRFQDPLKTIESFGDHFLVVCPSCAGCASVRHSPAENTDIRFVCSSCGRSEYWVGNRGAGVLCVGSPVDWYFHYPVWLAGSCCGETLWAYNKDHLDFLERYVSATLRERAAVPPLAGAGIRNSSLASRLPCWIGAANNRKRILSAIAKLQERLPR